MREQLKPHCDKRMRFVAIFDRYSFRKDHKKRKIKTALVVGAVEKQTKAYMCDHIWFDNSEHFEKLKLQKGDFVEFSARVVAYKKYTVPKLQRTLPHDSYGIYPLQMDYTLSQLKDVKRYNVESK